MPTVRATVDLQMEFSGAGAGWTSVKADVLTGVSKLVAKYGIAGSGPADRVASTGTMTFALDNSAGNSAGLIGYYSPNHANLRSGFGIGIGVRLAVTYGGTTYYKWRGTIASIEPVGGVRLERVTHVVAVDWMDEAARALLNQVALQVSQRSDQAFSAVLANITRQPAATSIATGIDTYSYALDNIQDETTTALAAFQTIAASEVGLVFLRGDTAQGGTLVFENRQTREAATSSATFTNTMVKMQASRARQELLNRIKVTTHPRQVDAAATTVLWSLTNTTTQVVPGASVTIMAPYRDPIQRAARVGGTSMVAPVATTDYTMNTASDGSGSDLTSSFSVAATFGGNSASILVTNNHATLAGYVTKLQIRGKGVYAYEAALMTADDASSQATYGLNVFKYDMPYQDVPSNGQLAADYFLNLYSSPLTYLRSMSIEANTSAALMTQALAREISDRITVVETVTGLNTDYYINAVELVCDAGDILTATWTLAPAPQYSYWLLGTTNYGELGQVTRLGF